MSKESFYNNIKDSNNSNKERDLIFNKKNKSKNWWDSIKRQIKTSTILGLGGAMSLGSVKGQDIKREANQKFSQDTNKIEALGNFKEIKNKLREAGDRHGDLDIKTNNKYANLENKYNYKEKNVYNSVEAFNQALKNDEGEESYYPHQVGTESPFWNTHGSIPINNMEDYQKHTEEDLIPEGFKGELTPDIKYFGFKLEKDEFITTLKQDVLVLAEVIGGKGWVRLNAGTRVIYKRDTLEDGRPCNILKYIADCINPIYGDDPYTAYIYSINKDGTGKYYITPQESKIKK